MLDIDSGYPGIDEDGKASFAQIAIGITEPLNELFPNYQDIQIIAEPGRYFAAACMDLVTPIIGSRFNNKDYFTPSSIEDNQLKNAENVCYINGGIYGSLSNILYGKTNVQY